MKNHYLLSLLFALTFLSCTQMSEFVKDESAGLNGGFEITQKGIPVNWLMYTPNTVPDADFEIVLDSKEFKEGKQSLRFDVKACSGMVGWRSPGFTNEFFETGKFNGPATYKLSFWIKNEGSKYRITAGGVEAKGGDMKTLFEGSDNANDWQQKEYKIDIKSDRWLRMQLNILQPGTFWIDDIRIEKL